MSPLAIAGIYVLTGALWIMLSSAAVETLSTSPATLAKFETLKGWGFVLVTGAILYALMRRRAAALERSETARAEREGFYRSLIEHASDSILVLNRDGTVRYASPAIQRHTGHTAESLVDRNVFDLIHPDDLTRVHAAFDRALENSAEVVGAEYRLRHADGSWRYASSIGRRLPGDGTRLVINTRDITDSRLVEEQFRRAQKFQAVGELTAGIVHDVNNVLAVVLANAELLLGELRDDRQEEHRAVQDIKRAALGGAEMVRKLLGFSRQADLHIAPLDPLDLLNEVGAMLRRILAPNIRLQVEVPKPVPPVLADSGAIVQILLNLATNARDAMPEGGSLRISASQVELDARYLEEHAWVVPGPYVRVDVRDTGVGMDDLTKARIFEPFFTTKPPGKGTGLGMAMVQGLVKQHGGHVEITSVVDLGTTVTVLLPAAPIGTASEPKTKHALVRGGTELVLLVEDEEALRRSGRRILEKIGYTVLTAGDGEEGLRVVEEREGKVDLILTDVQMAGMGGVQFYHAVRQRWQVIPVVFTSGEPALSFREDNGLEHAPFLQKPWTMEEAASALRAALDGGASR